MRFLFIHRRNPAMFRDKHGILHPIRHSKDYDENLVDERAEQRQLFGMTTEEDQQIREYQRLEEREREKEKREAELAPLHEQLTDLEAEREALREYLHDEPAARYTDLIRKGGQWRGEINRIPLAQARKVGLNPRMIKANAIETDRQGRRYLKWEYVLDVVAQENGYPDGDAFKDAIEQAAKDKHKLARLESEMAETRRKLRREGMPHRRNPFGIFDALALAGAADLAQRLIRHLARRKGKGKTQ